MQSFRLHVVRCGPRKIEVIKTLRRHLDDLPLLEAKRAVDDPAHWVRCSADNIRLHRLADELSALATDFEVEETVEAAPEPPQPKPSKPPKPAPTSDGGGGGPAPLPY